MFPLSCHPRLAHQAKDQSAQACGQSKRQRLSSDRFSHRQVVAGRCQVTLEVIEASWRRAQQLTAPAVAGWKGGAQLAGGQAAALEVALRRKKYDLQQQAPATAVAQTDRGHHHHHRRQLINWFCTMTNKGGLKKNKPKNWS